MHSYITPDVSTPCSTASRRPPARQIVLIARMWWRWPPSIALPGVEIDAERGAEQRLLDVVHGQRVAGEQDVDEAAANQLLEMRRSAGVHDHRAGDDGDPAARRP